MVLPSKIGINGKTDCYAASTKNRPSLPTVAI